MDHTGIEIRPEVLKGLCEAAPDKLDIALAGSPVSAEEETHCRRFICILQCLQGFLLFNRKEALCDAKDPVSIFRDLLNVDSNRVI